MSLHTCPTPQADSKVTAAAAANAAPPQTYCRSVLPIPKFIYVYTDSILLQLSFA